MASEEVSPKGSPVSSPLHSSPLPGDEEHQCAICSEKLKQPKVLSCLHVFCQECLEKQLNENKGEESTQSVTPPPQVIKCPTCEQETRLTFKGVAGFPTEHIISDMLDISVIEDMQIVCTSCKAKEKAVARCTDCANFLCPNCVTAHQFMRCFENHKVVSFEDMQNGDGVKMHKPILCDLHPAENLKYYCNTCQVPICNECMIAEHRQPEHMHEKVEDVEDEVKEELKNLISECKSKITFCQEATTMLENALSDLQTQRDNAKGLIQETFQSYKAILEKKKDEILNELEETHSHQELTIMEMFHNVGKTVEKMEDGCDFTSHVLSNGNSLQLVLLKKLITTQLLSLINNTPKPDVAINIEFKSNSNLFTEAVGKTFGSLVKEDPKIEANMCSLHSSFENEGFTLPHGVLSPGHPILPPVHLPEFLSTMRAITPVSINGSIGNIGSLVSIPPPSSIASSIAANLPPLPEGASLSNNSHSPVNSDSGISVDAGSTGSSQGNTMMNMNIAALAKLGAVGFNSQGQVTLNGQVVQGLNLSNIPPPISSAPNSRTTTPNMLQQDSGLTSMLNVNTSTTRSQNQNLESLANLFSSQATPPINGVGNPLLGMGTFGNLNSLDNIGSLDTMISPSDSEISTFDPSSVNQPFPPVRRANKMSAMQIRCKFGQLGPGKGQFNSPHGFCLGLDEDIIVADTNNHRIQVFEKTGEFKYQFGIPGREEGQLWYPRKVAVMRSSGKFVVCDRGNERSRMQIFTKNGHFIKKIAIRYIDIVAGLAITQQGHVVAVDSVSPTVFCIAESGDLIKWFDCSDYMREPSDIAVSGKEYFVCDFKGHCVVVFNEDGQFARRIGCENITNYPNGIDISDAGDVLIGDSHGNRFHVAVFQRDGSLIGEFQCPYVKVSRCCGLKITSEGYIVTLAKNNHHVLVLNTLYIT